MSDDDEFSMIFFGAITSPEVMKHWCKVYEIKTFFYVFLFLSSLQDLLSLDIKGRSLMQPSLSSYKVLSNRDICTTRTRQIKNILRLVRWGWMCDDEKILRQVWQEIKIRRWRWYYKTSFNTKKLFFNTFFLVFKKILVQLLPKITITVGIWLLDTCLSEASNYQTY